MILVNIECDKNTTSGKYQIVTQQPHARLLIQEVQYQYNEFINNQLKCAKDPILFVWVEFEHSALHCSFFDVVCDPSVRSQDLLFSHHDMRIKFWWNLCNDIFFSLIIKWMSDDLFIKYVGSKIETLCSAFESKISKLTLMTLEKRSFRFSGEGAISLQ